MLEPISSFSHYYVNSLLVTVINMTYKNLASKCETAVNLLIQIKKVSSTEKKNRNKTTNPSWIKPKSLYLFEVMIHFGISNSAVYQYYS